eukprot:g61267.t1
MIISKSIKCHKSTARRNKRAASEAECAPPRRPEALLHSSSFPTDSQCRLLENLQILIQEDSEVPLVDTR